MTIENDKCDSVFLLTQFSFFLFRRKFAHLLSNFVNELNENLLSFDVEQIFSRRRQSAIRCTVTNNLIVTRYQLIAARLIATRFYANLTRKRDVLDARRLPKGYLIESPLISTEKMDEVTRC